MKPNKYAMRMVSFLCAAALTTLAHAQQTPPSTAPDEKLSAVEEAPRQEDPQLTDAIEAANETGKDKQGRRTIEEKIKSRFGVQDDTIADLRNEKFGYGEIITALSLAERMDGGINDANIQTIVSMRKGDQKQGWGQIAKEFDVTVGDLRKNINSVHKPSASPPREVMEGQNPPSSVSTGRSQGQIKQQKESSNNRPTRVKEQKQNAAPSRGMKKGFDQSRGHGPRK